jgi:hypothetical protein
MLVTFKQRGPRVKRVTWSASADVRPNVRMLALLFLVSILTVDDMPHVVSNYL